jgi:hypothetical protein
MLQRYAKQVLRICSVVNQQRKDQLRLNWSLDHFSGFATFLVVFKIVVDHKRASLDGLLSRSLITSTHF